MKSVYYIDPPAELEQRIFSRMHRIALINYVLLGSFSALSFVAVISTCIKIYQDIMRSGFGEFIALAFSDSTVVMNYWKEILFSLVDSLPMLGLVLFLLAAAVFIWSAAKTKKLQWI